MVAGSGPLYRKVIAVLVVLGVEWIVLRLGVSVFLRRSPGEMGLIGDTLFALLCTVPAGWAMALAAFGLRRWWLPGHSSARRLWVPAGYLALGAWLVSLGVNFARGLVVHEGLLPEAFAFAWWGSLVFSVLPGVALVTGYAWIASEERDRTRRESQPDPLPMAPA